MKERDGIEEARRLLTRPREPELDAPPLSAGMAAWEWWARETGADWNTVRERLEECGPGAYRLRTPAGTIVDGARAPGPEDDLTPEEQARIAMGLPAKKRRRE